MSTLRAAARSAAEPASRAAPAVLWQVLCHQVQVQVQVQEVKVQVPVPIHEVQVQVQVHEVQVQVESTIAQNFIILNISQKSLVSLKCTK